MQISALKELLHQISRLISPKEAKQSAETSEPQARADESEEILIGESEGCGEIETVGENDNSADPEEKAENATDFSEKPNDTSDLLEETDEDALSLAEETDEDALSLTEGMDSFDETDCDFNDESKAPQPKYKDKKPIEGCKTQSLKEHLISSVPRTARLPKGALTKGEIAEIRSILGDLDDAEIHRLYRKVTK